jgi:hypothetical protein
MSRPLDLAGADAEQDVGWADAENRGAEQHSADRSHGETPRPKWGKDFWKDERCNGESGTNYETNDAIEGTDVDHDYILQRVESSLLISYVLKYQNENRHAKYILFVS